MDRKDHKPIFEDYKERVLLEPKFLVEKLAELKRVALIILPIITLPKNLNCNFSILVKAYLECYNFNSIRKSLFCFFSMASLSLDVVNERNIPRWELLSSPKIKS